MSDQINGLTEERKDVDVSIVERCGEQLSKSEFGYGRPNGEMNYQEFTTAVATTYAKEFSRADKYSLIPYSPPPV